MLGRPVLFDFTGKPPDPDWIVHGLIERGTITVLSADSGAGKSLVCKSMAVAIMHETTWIGRPTCGERVMFVDEENFLRVVHGRFSALGMTNDDRDQLRYFLRIGVQLGSADWMERVRAEMDEFRPDILFIDTAAAATSVEVNDNTGVARLFATSLRPLADYSAVVLLHHERKPAQGFKRNAAHAMMGARQWAGQADAHLSIEKLGEVEVDEHPDGSMTKRYPIRLEMPKSRDGDTVNEALAIVSEHDVGSTTPRWLRVERTRP
jgi:energy-coupling factor transporter ATP-binding protein EcfA2